MSSRARELPALPTFRDDEATGTRLKGTVSPALLPESPCVIGRRLLDAGRAGEALELLADELRVGKESAELQLLLGRAAFGLGDYGRAQRALSRAVALSPEDADARRWLARALLRDGNPVAAMRVWRRAARSTVPPKLVVLEDEPIELLDVCEEAPEPEDAEYEEPPTTEWIPEARRSSIGLILPKAR